VAGSGTAHLRPPDQAVVRAEGLVVEFPAAKGQTVHAVSNVSLDVTRGETLGLVGESGCGKSTTGRAIVQLPRPNEGKVLYDGRDLTSLSTRELRSVRPELQLIYQDPISSLNPYMTVEQVITEPLAIWGKGDKKSRRAQAEEILAAVGLDPKAALTRHPRQFSGGQCQRICIARALVLEPKMLILDEPVSALDVSVQAQILNLLEEMKARYGLTMVFIAHDLAVVRNVSDRVAVMYLGKVCEVGATIELFDTPAHPYTDGLLSAIPKLKEEGAEDVEVKILAGELPSPLSPPSGCRFRTRCPRAQERCAQEEPKLRPVGTSGDQYVACHFPLVDAAPVPVEVGAA
jgi:peptide/nickel transport system ATP-binding protein